MLERKKVKAIIISDNTVYESTNVRVFRDFIIVDGVPYPKPKPHITEKCVYYIIANTIPEDMQDKLERLVKKKEVESIFSAITASANPMRYLMYVVMGIFAGMYLDRFAQNFLETLERMPPETAASIAQSLQFIAIAAMIAIPAFYFIVLKRKSD